MSVKQASFILAVLTVISVSGLLAIQSLSQAQADDLQGAIDTRVQGAIDTRRALMKEMSAQMKVIYRVVDAKSGDLSNMAKRAQLVQADAAKIPTLFPSGSSIRDLPDKTHAKPEIWQNPADFKSAAANLGTQAGKLADAAKTGDMGTFSAQFDATGKACGNCHTDFRAKLQ
jgi:cytochrome c556